MAAKSKRRAIPSETVVQLPQLSLRASVAPETLDHDKREVDVVWTTGARVLRGFFERYYEELSLEPKHVRMGRLASGGAPVLDSHNQFELDAVIGVVGSARLEKDRGVARIRFARDERGERAFAKVKDGILRNVSVGYAIHRMEKVEDGDDTVPVYRAVDWEPHELSIVPVPADAGAQVRSDGAQTPCVFFTRSVEEPKMAKSKKKPQGGAPAAAPAAIRGDKKTDDDETDGEGRSAEDDADDDEGEGADDVDDAAEDESKEEDARSVIVLAERRRLIGIDNANRVLIAPQDSLAERAKERGWSVEKFIRVASGKIASEEEPIVADDNRPRAEGTGRHRIAEGTRTRIQAVPGGEPRDRFRSSAVAWLLMRSGLADAVIAHAKKRGETLTLDPGEVRGMTTLRLAEECLSRAGVRTRGMEPLRIAELAFDARAGGYQTTSDFPVILDEVVNRTLLAQYELVDPVWRQLVKVGSVSDFNPTKWVRLGTLGRLDKVPEHAEFRNKQIPDGAAEELQAETFGNIFAVTRQVLINDDLGAILRMVGDIAQTAALTIELEFWDMLNLNSGLGPDMSDGNPLFDTAHGNIQPTGTDLGVAGLDANRQLMSAQTDPSGNYYLALRPTILLVPTTLGMKARNLIESEFDMDEADGVTPNGVRNLVSTVIDSPYVSGTRRYLFADPQRNPTFGAVFLNGQQTPFTESRDGWRIDGKEYKVRIDVGLGAVDWRTAVTDDGTP